MGKVLVVGLAEMVMGVGEKMVLGLAGNVGGRMTVEVPLRLAEEKAVDLIEMFVGLIGKMAVGLVWEIPMGLSGKETLWLIETVLGLCVELLVW